MAYWMTYVKAWIEEQKGQDLAEYALLLVLIALAVITALTAVGGQLNAVWDAITSALDVSS